MPAEAFNCPNCGAPLEYEKIDTPTVRCPFCDTSVIVPEQMRTPGPPEMDSVVIQYSTETTPTIDTSRQVKRVFWTLGIIIALFAAVIIILPLLIARQASDSVSAIVAMPLEELTPTRLPSPTLPPSPTPAYAVANLTFGEKGIGPGMLNDARYIGVDGNGDVYTADYQDGRVEVFDSTGKYLRQWKVGNAKTIILGMVVSHAGEVYLSYDDGIAKVDGKTGKVLQKLANPDGGEFGDLALSSNGNLLAAWYEGRWGMITSLEGHRDDVIVFSPEGKIILKIPSIISAQTGDLALDNSIATDGLDNIYVLSDQEIFKFTPEGKFIDRFSAAENDTSQPFSPSAIAVDGQGRIFASSTNQVNIISPEGRFINTFPTDGGADRITFDEKGNLWVVAREKIIQYTFTGK